MGLPFFFSHQQTAIWKGRKNPSFRGRSNDHHGTINHIRPSWVPILQVAKERANSQRSLHGGSIRFCPRICPGKHAIWKIDIPYPLLPKFHPCYMFIWQMWSYKKNSRLTGVVYMKPTQTLHYFSGKSAQIYHICIKFHTPEKKKAMVP